MAWCCWSPATAREIIPRKPGGAPGPRQRELSTGHPRGNRHHAKGLTRGAFYRGGTSAEIAG